MRPNPVAIHVQAYPLYQAESVGTGALAEFLNTPIDAQAADMDTFSNPLGIDTDHVRYASDRITPKA